MPPLKTQKSNCFNGERKDWVCKLAQSVIKSSDLVAIEDLKVKNMVCNHKLAKSINDASWSKFREWLEYFGAIYGVPVIAVAPHYEVYMF